METSNSFGYWLRRRRKALDLTQEALAQQAGCTADAIKKIEADLRRPSRQLAERLADCLAVPADERPLFLKIARAERSPERLPVVDQPLTQAPPSSTITTFLLTDIQNCTALWEQYPAAMPAALERYDAILRQTIAGYQGHLYQTLNDRISAAFATPAAALAAAVAAQRALCAADWSALANLPVRMALHTGETLMRDGSYVGRAIHRTARLIAAGHGGQILLSQATVELVRDALPPDVALHNLGERRLPSLHRPERIFQVVAPNLPATFPPLRTPDLCAHNLPAQPNRFVGRRRERTAVRDLLRRSDVRLVTLTGPGGAGKTRLALAIAEDLLHDFPDGVWFVDLAPITDSALLTPRIAHALGVTESGNRPLVASLHAHLRTRRLLLLLDNLEQVNDIARHVAQLLAAAPGVKALATSRVSLNISAEYERAVPPLELPGRRAEADADRLLDYAAVQLFVERARAVNAAFTLTAAHAPAVVAICRRLDGLPLAIELAAARLKTSAPALLLGQLENRLATLTDGPRDLPARQQTLRATIAWSFDLLTPEEQAAFMHLAIFAGGCTPAAATTVIGRRPDTNGNEHHAIETTLHALADKSLLRCTDAPGETPRFTMLETIREYALEHLSASGAHATAQRRHTNYYVALAEEAQSRLTGPRRSQWLELLDAEADNLREVLERSAAAPDGGGTLLRLGAALWWYWYFRGKASEGRTWLEAALAQAGAGTPEATVHWACCGAGVLAWVQGDQQTAAGHLAASVAGWRALGDAGGLAYALTFYGIIHQYQFDYPGAQALHEESIALFRRRQDRWGLALALAAHGDLCYFTQNPQQARALLAESINLARELSDTWNLAWALSGLGFVAYDEGAHTEAERFFAESIALMRHEGSKLRLAATLNKQGNLLRLGGRFTDAAECYEQSLAMFRELDTQLVVAGPLHNLGFLALHAGDDRRAAALFAESIAVAQAQQDWAEVATGLGGLAAVAARRGDAACAARIFAAMERLLAGTGEDLDRANRLACDAACAEVRRVLGAARFAAAWVAGEAVPAEQVIAEALQTLV